EEILKGLRSAPPRKDADLVTTYSAEDIIIHQYGNAAVVAFRLMISTTRPDGTTGLSSNLNTGTFIKRNGKWQVVAWQSTVVPIKEDNAKPILTTPPIKPASLAGSSMPSTSSQVSASGARVYQKGTRGGCYYLNGSGAKIYVDHKFCN